MPNKSEYKILVISDTHGDYSAMNKVVEKELPFDYLIHCGDAQVDPDSILDHREQYGLLAVKGNCDWFVKLPDTLFRKIGYYNILVLHGHKQDVHSGHKYLLKNAKLQFADVVLYGHTHRPLVKRYEDQGVLVVNPGSLTQNRPYGTPGTYAILTISEDTLPEARIVEFEEN